jgi:hypothetical protein
MAKQRIADAAFVCWVEAFTQIDELTNDLKVYTWETR